MNSQLPCRGEILFLYDAKDSNPNGDPLDENRPRIDPETRINLVTDVRLKRTVRDYVHNYVYIKDPVSPEGMRKRIFVIEEVDDNGVQSNVEKRAINLKFEKIEDFLSCWDVRLFGGTLAIKNSSWSLTGPVQFHMGRSLNPVNIHAIQGTSVFSSTGKEKMGSMRMEYQVFYSLIAFWGVINPTTAERQNIPLSESDIELLIEALWEGTRNLTTRSKLGQIPRLLLRINYKPEHSKFFLGELERGIKFIPSKDLEIDAVRCVDDYNLDITILLDRIKKHTDKIGSIEFRKDTGLKLQPDLFNDDNIKSLLKSI